MEKVLAPFSETQVESLNGYQKSGVGHPFTCAYRGDGSHPYNAVLIATEDGWICPHCPYTQNWAHTEMTDNAWKELRNALKEMGFGFASAD